jgi:hypothetical protein
MTKHGLAFTLSIWLAGAASAYADCDHFKWPLAREKAWFAQALKPVEAGAEIGLADQAFLLALKPSEAASYLLPLKKAAAAGSFGGVVKVASVPKAGTYEVTLSREAWVDVIQDQARAKSLNVSRQRDCASLRKSVRFALNAGPAALQISGVDSSAIVFALAAAP